MRLQTRLNGLSTPTSAAEAARAEEGVPALGSMPEWNLADLYKAPDAPEVAHDIEAAAAAAQRMKERYQGKLTQLGRDGAALATAIEEFEQLVEILGKLGSFAGLYYAANQADPERAKFYGDISEKLTAISTDIIFFDLELNQIDEPAMANALKGGRRARYKPWIDNIRKEKP